MAAREPINAELKNHHNGMYLQRNPFGNSRADNSDSLLIIPGDDGNEGTLYYASVSETECCLHKASLPSIPSNSSLVINSDHIKRLQNAHVFAIVSSLSGAGLATTAFDNILLPLLQLFSINATVHKTHSKSSHREFLATIPFSPDHDNIILIFGGDTMIYDLINTLPSNTHLTESLRLTLSPIPCGTGNALAMSLGITSIPIGISKFFGVSESSSVEHKLLPLMKVTIQEQFGERVIWAAVVLSWALHASLVADSDDPEMRRQYGAKRFAVAAERLLSPEPHVYRGMIQLGHRPVSVYDHTYLLFTHVSHLEPTFPIAPSQSPLASSVTMIQIGKMSGNDLMGVMRAVYNNSKHLQLEGVQVIDGLTEISFVIDENEGRFRRICIDGDIVTVEPKAVISLRMLQGIQVGETLISLYV